MEKWHCYQSNNRVWAPSSLTSTLEALTSQAAAAACSALHAKPAGHVLQVSLDGSRMLSPSHKHSSSHC